MGSTAPPETQHNEGRDGKGNPGLWQLQPLAALWYSMNQPHRCDLLGASAVALPGPIIKRALLPAVCAQRQKQSILQTMIQDLPLRGGGGGGGGGGSSGGGGGGQSSHIPYIYMGV